MAGAMVGGAFLSATLQVLFDRMASRPVIDFIRGQKLSDAPLKKLKLTLLAVNAVLNDAEDKQITNPAVKAWLDELNDAIYDAEDLLDEIATEASRSESEAETHTSVDQVRNFISSSLNQFREEITSKIDEILERLEYIAKQKDVLELNNATGGRLFQKLPSSSLVEESGVYGRDDDKERIIQLLLSSCDEIRVIPIVGMGGVGKTTLAQLVYNDDRLIGGFDLKAWVCVSEEFDVSRVTKTILEAVTSSASDIKDLSLLQVKLKERVIGKKFLLVLDDVWNEKYNDWDLLQNPFKSGAKGSTIIVTTRSENVASIMRTTPTHHLKQLLDEDCWSVFSKHAFYNANLITNPKLQAIGREIVKKCKGLPLAAKTLGGLLRSKVDVDEWDGVLKSNIWDFSDDESDILPALRLSYHYLPSQLKQCFAYCSIFPKDFKFEKQQLVLLWMAEDLLQHPNGNYRIEKVGEDYFHDLISRSLFQRSSNDKSCFIMHDLVNDLAKFVSRRFCFRLGVDDPHEISEKTRHISYFRTRFDAFKKFEAFNDAKGLRTFLPLNWSLTQYDQFYLTNKVPHVLLPTLRCLRVLSLSRYKNMNELPNSIGSLKHLRYLDLSFTAIRMLPDCITTLYNLQTLMLLKCASLVELPIDIWKLVNLRHLYVSGTNLKEMPRHMSRLRNLQTLSTFIVGKLNGCAISELREFQHLRGALHITELQNVVHSRDAIEATLKDKEFIDELVLEWSVLTEDSQNERDILDKLQPHANLKKLSIEHYSGTRFPDWLRDHSLCNVVYLRLSNCKYCFCLPPLGQLPCLKDLFIGGFDGVERVGPEFYGSGSLAVKPFGSLEILRFEKMLEWVDWSFFGDEGGEFPNLRKLLIKDCPKLTGGLPNHLPCLTQLLIFECQQLVSSLPRAPVLCYLDLIKCDKVVLTSNTEVSSDHSLHAPEISQITCQPLDQMATSPNRVGLQHMSSIEVLKVSGISELKELPPWLHRLTITRCATLEFLPDGMVHISSCLCYLEISYCHSLKSFPKGGLPTTLKALSVFRCRKLELFPHIEAEQNYYLSLESLSIGLSCDSLKSFPLGLFPKLNDLSIRYCKNMESLWIPKGLQEDLTSLCNMNIRHCPKLVSFPNGGLPTPNLTEFWVSDCKNLKSLPEKMSTLFPSLQRMHISECPEVEMFPEGGLPSNLVSLYIHDCNKLMARRLEWGLQRLTSLKHFETGKYEEVESFPTERILPSSLTFLKIRNFPNLKRVDMRGLQHVTSLEKLYIWNCPVLQSLPEEGMQHLTSLEKIYILNCPQLRCLPQEGFPTSLSLLEIRDCPLLEHLEWPKIASTLCIVIDGKLIQ